MVHGYNQENLIQNKCINKSLQNYGKNPTMLLFILSVALESVESFAEFDHPPHLLPLGSSCMVVQPLTPIMASNIKVIFLLLWLLQCEGQDVDVQQKPPIQVALLREGISIPCKVIFPYRPKYTNFLISYYWINSLGQKTSIYSTQRNVIIPSGQENTTAMLSYDHVIISPENTFSTGTYYCQVNWNDIQQTGKGVFVLARGTGYVETSHRWEILITLTALLAALSITTTALLLWKRKVLCPRKNQLNVARQVETQPPSANPAPPPPPPSPPPVYDCLDLQQVDVYSSILENDTNNPSPRKSLPGKRPRKQTTLEESSDTLYENI
ncbi:LOW QUALITY PROTEIN: NFAT activation molecule 1 [Porphyrio hochstetteri]